MKDPITNKKILKVMFGFFVIGSVAAMVRIYQSTKYLEHSFISVKKEDDEIFFV